MQPTRIFILSQCYLKSPNLLVNPGLVGGRPPGPGKCHPPGTRRVPSRPRKLIAAAGWRDASVASRTCGRPLIVMAIHSGDAHFLPGPLSPLPFIPCHAVVRIDRKGFNPEQRKLNACKLTDVIAWTCLPMASFM